MIKTAIIKGRSCTTYDTKGIDNVLASGPADGSVGKCTYCSMLEKAEAELSSDLHIHTHTIINKTYFLSALERQLSNEKHMLLFQRTRVQFPGPTRGDSQPSGTLAPGLQHLQSHACVCMQTHINTQLKINF